MKNDEWRQEIEGKDLTRDEQKALDATIKRTERNYLRRCKRAGVEPEGTFLFVKVPGRPESQRVCEHAISDLSNTDIVIGASGQVLPWSPHGDRPWSRIRRLRDGSTYTTCEPASVPRTGAVVMQEAEQEATRKYGDPQDGYRRGLWSGGSINGTRLTEHDLMVKRGKLISRARAEAEALDRDIERERERMALRDLEVTEGFDCLGQLLIPDWLADKTDPERIEARARLDALTARVGPARAPDAGVDHPWAPAGFWADSYKDAGLRRGDYDRPSWR